MTAWDNYVDGKYVWSFSLLVSEYWVSHFSIVK